MPSLGLTFEGAAYHDGNFGEVPLGTDLRGWDWSRKSDARATVVTYRPWGGDELSVSVTDTGVEVRRAPAGEAPRHTPVAKFIPAPNTSCLPIGRDRRPRSAERRATGRRD